MSNETTHTALRLKIPIHEKLKEMCDHYRLSISEVLRVLITLFMADENLRTRVKTLIEQERLVK